MIFFDIIILLSKKRGVFTALKLFIQQVLKIILEKFGVKGQTLVIISF